MKASDIQIGGGHYKKYAIQPVHILDLVMLPFSLSNMIKYMRHADKGGLSDIRKAYHCVLLYRENPHSEEMRAACLKRLENHMDLFKSFAAQFDYLEAAIINMAAKEYCSGSDFGFTIELIAGLYQANGGNVADLPRVA